MTTPAGSPANPLRIDLAKHVGVELGRSATAQISLNETAVRNLAGKASGEIRLSDLWNKSSEILVTISSNITNHTINVSQLAGYVAGKSTILIRVNSGVYVYSTSTSVPALTITGGASGDKITLENNGYIIGMGGAGARAGTTAAGVGGTALSLGFSCTIQNNSYIAGGGGGGGGYSNFSGGGGGAGGGPGGGAPSGLAGSTPNTAGGLPGLIGANGNTNGGQGGGGGRILPGIGGAGGRGRVTYVGAQGGGSGGGGAAFIITTFNQNPGTDGTAGGSSNSSASNNGGQGGGGGGGWGAAGGNGGAFGTGGGTAGALGGKAIALNGNSVTYALQGTIWGSVS